MILSPHFTLEEMTVSQTAARNGYANDPSPFPDLMANGRRLCSDLLEPIRTVLGDHTVVVSSGYRSAQLNLAVGGSVTPVSAHCDFRAADFTVPALPLLVLYQQLAAVAPTLPLDQLIWEYDAWVHASVAKLGATPRRQFLMKFAGRDYEVFDLETVKARATVSA